MDLIQIESVPADILSDYNSTRVCSDKGTLCHAPETAMYISRNGFVSACCYSKSAPLGQFPEQTLEEIWFGLRANTMRKSLRNSIFPGGCELCAEEMLARNFSGYLGKLYDIQTPMSQAEECSTVLPGPNSTSTNRRYPVRVEIELSNRCNLECAMCSGFFSSSIRANREKLPALPMVYGNAFVEQFTPFIPYLKNANFVGGEPFLIDIYYQIWELFMELNPNCNISITTNGTVYTGRVKRVLENLNCHINVSLDSVNKATYESIRKNATFERTLSNLDAFTEINVSNGKPLTISTCAMVSNWSELPDIIEFANQRGIRLFFNTVVFPMEYSLKSLPNALQGEIFDYFNKSARPPVNDIEAGNFSALDGLARQIEFWMRERLPSERTPLQHRCSELLEAGFGARAVQDLLGDLAGRSEKRSIIPAGDLIRFNCSSFFLAQRGSV